VEIEMPITLIQEEIKPVAKNLQIETKISFTLIGKIKPNKEILNIDDFSLVAIRPHKGPHEDADFEDNFEEV